MPGTNREPCELALIEIGSRLPGSIRGRLERVVRESGENSNAITGDWGKHRLLIGSSKNLVVPDSALLRALAAAYRPRLFLLVGPATAAPGQAEKGELISIHRLIRPDTTTVELDTGWAPSGEAAPRGDTVGSGVISTVDIGAVATTSWAAAANRAVAEAGVAAGLLAIVAATAETHAEQLRPPKPPRAPAAREAGAVFGAVMTGRFGALKRRHAERSRADQRAELMLGRLIDGLL